MASAHSDDRIRLLRAVPAPRARLCGFAHAGGSATAYRPWATAPELPGDIELLAVELPGRDRRAGQPFATDLVALADEIVVALAPVSAAPPDVPFAFFGHCMGAAVAFECARALRRAGRPGPAHLFVAGLAAPHLPRGSGVAHTLPEGAFVDWLARRGGLPDGLRAAPDVLALLLPRVRADLALWAGYRCAPEAPLPCGLTVLGGADDPDTDDRSLEAWRELVADQGRFDRRTFPGGHFFVQEHRNEILRMIERAI